jgi:hypothetical protein
LWTCRCRPNDFRETSFEIEAFHRDRDLATKQGRGRNNEGQWYVRFRFANPTVADAFRDRFGGERLTSPRSEVMR